MPSTLRPHPALCLFFGHPPKTFLLQAVLSLILESSPDLTSRPSLKLLQTDR